MSLFGKFVSEGNEKADELAKEGAMLDGMNGAGESYYSSAKKRRFVRHCKMQRAFTVWWRNRVAGGIATRA